MLVCLSVGYTQGTVCTLDTETGRVMDYPFSTAIQMDIVGAYIYIYNDGSYGSDTFIMDNSFVCKVRDVAYDAKGKNLYFRGYAYSLGSYSITYMQLGEQAVLGLLSRNGYMEEATVDNGVLFGRSYGTVPDVLAVGEEISYTQFCRLVCVHRG